MFFRKSCKALLLIVKKSLNDCYMCWKSLQCRVVETYKYKTSYHRDVLHFL